MTVLSSHDIHLRRNHIFQSGYSLECLDRAAYNMRVGLKYMIIDGIEYREDTNPYPLHDTNGFIVLPPRKMVLLVTEEIFHLPLDLCAIVGISFSWEIKGLRPRFGPQVDPGYRGHFYAFVENESSQEIKVRPGTPIFKTVFITLSSPHDGQYFEYDIEGKKEEIIYLTSLDLVGDVNYKLLSVENTVTNIQLEVQHTQVRIEEVTSGYKMVTIFGVFLVSTTLIAAFLSFIISSTSNVLLGSTDSIPDYIWHTVLVSVIAITSSLVIMSIAMAKFILYTAIPRRE